MALTPEQQRAAISTGSVAVTAGAGTGKTHMLSERYLFHVQQQNLSPLQIVAVTFTEKAALELRSRIRQKMVERLGRDHEKVIELEAAQISTIHALATRICREHPQEAGVPVDFQVLEESEGNIYRSESLPKIIEQIPQEDFGTLPYSLAECAIREYLNDPITAREALCHEPSHWQNYIQEISDSERQALIRNEIWINTRQTLQTICALDPSDKLDEIRKITLNAMIAFELNNDPDQHYPVLRGIRVNCGSRKNWKEGDLDACKAALKEFRCFLDGYEKKCIYHLSSGSADALLIQYLPLIRNLCNHMHQELSKKKYHNRVLDFVDLEVHALKALEHDSVCQYYQQRWKAILIDEFQDTNPIQSRLLTRISRDCIATIVGDVKQSIYGFRRADVRVFQQYQDQITASGGEVVVLSQCFRSNRDLVHTLNRMFQPILTNTFQALQADRKCPHQNQTISCFHITSTEKVPLFKKRQAEARHIARILKAYLTDGIRIHDGTSDTIRPITPGDIAILSRTWDPLDTYAEYLTLEGIPSVHAGGGNLLQTREARDGIALLQFLADPTDDISLVALLRSPFFGISDRTLYLISQIPLKVPDHQNHWWRRIQECTEIEVKKVTETLTILLEKTVSLSPSELLRLLDHLCGYRAIVRNLSNGERRLADWNGFLQWVQQEEKGLQNCFAFIRKLKKLMDYQVEIPRPVLHAHNAVSLMTIHAAKGLEWSLVVVPDLSRKLIPDQSQVLFDAKVGFAVKCSDSNDSADQPLLFQVLKKEKQQREEAEARRLLYVACTRARDLLILSSAEASGGMKDIMNIGIQTAGLHWEEVPYEPASLTSADNHLPPDHSTVSFTTLLHREKLQVSDLPVISLRDYQQCPLKFRMRYIDKHPGLEIGGTHARRLGELAHLALEHSITDFERLKNIDPAIPDDVVQEALDLALNFHKHTIFQPFQTNLQAREHPITIKIGSIQFNGIIDLVGNDWILDYKTDREMNPERHRLQLAIYAHEMKVNTAIIAYLRHEKVHEYSAEELESAMEDVHEVIAGIEENRFEAAPSEQSCSWCPYQYDGMCGKQHN